MDGPFRQDRRGRCGAGGDWGWFGYRVIRNRVFRQKEEGGIDPSGGVELARGVFAMTIDGRGLDPQATRDLLGVHVRVNEAQALALTVGQSVSAARHHQPPALPSA
jgi:hypothetical protein